MAKEEKKRGGTQTGSSREELPEKKKFAARKRPLLNLHTKKVRELNGDIHVTRFAPLSRVAFREVLPSNLEIYTLSIVKKDIPEQAHTARAVILIKKCQRRREVLLLL